MVPCPVFPPPHGMAPYICIYIYVYIYTYPIYVFAIRDVSCGTLGSEWRHESGSVYATFPGLIGTRLEPLHFGFRVTVVEAFYPENLPMIWMCFPQMAIWRRKIMSNTLINRLIHVRFQVSGSIEAVYFQSSPSNVGKAIINHPKLCHQWVV